MLPDLNEDVSGKDQDLEEVVPTPIDDLLQERELHDHFNMPEKDAYYDGVGDPEITIEDAEESEVVGLDANDLDREEGFEEDFDKSDDEDEEASLARRAHARDSANIVEEGGVAEAVARQDAPPIRVEQGGVAQSSAQLDAPANLVEEGGVAESGARQDASANIGEKEAAPELDNKKDRAELPLWTIPVDRRKHYWFNFLHFKWWVIIFMATLAETEFPPKERLKVHDEVGFMLGNDEGQHWANVMDPWDIHLHGPRVSRLRVFQYIRYLFNETDVPAQTLLLKIRPNKKVYFGKYARASTPFVIKAKMNELGCLGRIKARLYSYSITSTKEWIKESREFLEVKLIELNDKQVA
ncbi:unnamed protein product [Closterium sp. NIES-54]